MWKSVSKVFSVYRIRQWCQQWAQWSRLPAACHHPSLSYSQTPLRCPHKPQMLVSHKVKQKLYITILELEYVDKTCRCSANYKLKEIAYAGQAYGAVSSSQSQPSSMTGGLAKGAYRLPVKASTATGAQRTPPSTPAPTACVQYPINTAHNIRPKIQHLQQQVIIRVKQICSITR